MENKQRELYKSFSHYQTLSEEEKNVFWQNRKVVLDSLPSNEKEAWQQATWSNIEDIKQHLLSLKSKFEKITPEKMTLDIGR